MNFKDYQMLSKRTMPKEFDGMAKSNYAMGLAGESGEVVDLIKKWVHHGHVEDKFDLEKELGDALHYLTGLATMYNLSLEGIATKNIIKLMERYPDGFSQEASRNRKERLNKIYGKHAEGMIVDEQV